jgi:hypothetical protein
VMQPVSYSPCSLTFTFILYHSSRASSPQEELAVAQLASPRPLLDSSFGSCLETKTHLHISKFLS